MTSISLRWLSLEQVAPLSFGCRLCPRLAACGGLYLPESGFFCTDACDSGTCRPGCISPKHPERYHRAIAYVRGTGSQDLEEIRCPDHLPEVLSVIRDGSLLRRYPAARAALEGWAAIPLRSVVRFPKAVAKGERGWSKIHHDAASLRRHFGLAPDTKLVLSCVDKDRRIEPVWRELHERGFMSYFRRLGFAAVTVPNFSLFDRDSRYQHEYNRKRSLIVAEELTRFGIPAVPNFHAMSPGDIVFWRDFLRSRPEITCLSLEFQTGLGDNDMRANATIDELARLQQDLGRSLHLVAIGGASFMDRIADRFPSSTLITSRPFLLAVFGRRMVRQPSGAFGEARDHAPRGSLFQYNHRLAVRACRNARRRSRFWRNRRPLHSVRGAQQLTLPAIAVAEDCEHLASTELGKASQDVDDDQEARDLARESA